MTALPFGQPYQLGQNTSGCRSIHQNMVPLRPSVHCPHIGPYDPLILQDMTNCIVEVVVMHVFRGITCK
jgi:hypothetical protein